jgi:hypothetical protein
MAWSGSPARSLPFWHMAAGANQERSPERTPESIVAQNNMPVVAAAGQWLDRQSCYWPGVGVVLALAGGTHVPSLLQTPVPCVPMSVLAAGSLMGTGQGSACEEVATRGRTRSPTQHPSTKRAKVV